MARDAPRTQTWALLLAIAVAGACDDTSTGDLGRRSESARVEPIWSGCLLIDDGRRCQLAHEKLRIWVPDAEPSQRWTLDDEATDPTMENAGAGVRFSFDASALEPGTHTLALWDPDGETPLFTLELVPDPIAADNFEFGDAVKAALESSSAHDRQELTEVLLAGPSASEVEEVARVHYARLLSYNARAPGDSATAVLAQLEREEGLAAEREFWGVRCQAALVGLFWGTHLEKSALTQRWGQLEAQCRERSAELGARFDHYLGKQAMQEGAYAVAEARLSNVVTTASRVLPEQSIEASKNLMELYARTGRWSEAQREVESLQALPLGVCERAEAEAWIGFVRVRARQSAVADLGDPRPGLEAALEAHRPHGACDNASLHVHDLAKLGYAAALRGDTSALRDSVERLSTERLDGKYQHQAAELELELAVAEQRFSDVPGLASAMDRLAKAGEPEAQWRRQMILAKAAVAQEDNAAAQTAYVAAEAVLDELWAGVTSYALRARWLSAYRRSALGLMRVRLDVDDLEGAACAARFARLRALDLHDGSGIAHDPCERAWARSEKEVVFLIVPGTQDDWDVFVVVQERVVEVTRVSAPESARDLDWWDPWAETIRSATRVRVLASGVALRSPLHQMGWEGLALVRQRPMTFGLDLDPQQSQASSTSPTASVVFADVDPYRALGRYAADIKDVHSTLQRGGWSPRWIETSGGGKTMEDAIERGGLLVYFGHGDRIAVASSAALDHAGDVGSTALLVARDAHWGAADVAALDRVPRWAVLLGCDVAFPDERSWSGGLNLAHALLLAGTREVLAATGPLDAAIAAEVGAPLLAADTSQSFELSDALHQVWAASPGSSAPPALGALRVWSR